MGRWSSRVSFEGEGEDEDKTRNKTLSRNSKQSAGNHMNDIDINEYSTAEITAAWIETKEGDRTAVFAVVELITDISWMETTRAPKHKTEGSIKIYVYQTQVSVAEGIQFYETGETENPYLKGITFSKNTLSLPPEGYITTHRNYICHPIYCAGISQLLPDRMVSLNVKCILNNDAQYFDTKFKPHLNKKFKTDLDKISKYLNETLQITINEHNHLFGSRLLCAQDPIFWKINLKLKRVQSQLSIMFFLRDQKEFSGCHCAIQTTSPIFQQPMGLYEINGRVITIPYSYRKSSISKETDYLLIWDSKGALIEKIPLIFLGEKFCSTIESRILPNGKRVPIWPESYYTDKSSNKRNFIEEGIQHRNHFYLSETNECCYFKKGEKTKDGEYAACRCVQDLLSQAGLEIIICDPYFYVDVFKRYIYGWVKCKSLIIITDARNFQNRINKDYMNKNQEKTEVSKKTEEIFKETILHCSNVNSFQSFSIIYAIDTKSGDKDILHDRHIVIDGTVSILTTSLNSIEKNDTAIFKSQNQEAILNRIEEWKTQPAVYEWSIRDVNS